MAKTICESLGVQPGDSLVFPVDELAQTAEVRPVKRRGVAEFRGIFKAGQPPDAPFKWATQRQRAWIAETDRLVPPAKHVGLALSGSLPDAVRQA